ncbi:MAG: DUF362 domain-containing protein [bacterium]|nr:DUF362 domain-containing protein [bacterium]
MEKNRVSIASCSDYDKGQVDASLADLLLPLGGMSSFVSKGDKVFIKPNLLKAALPEKAVTTHPSLVEAVVRAVLASGGVPLVGDSPGIGKMEKIFETTGMKGVADRTGAKLVEFSDSVEVETREGAIFKSLEISKDIMDADKVINLPKVKTHAQMHVTLGVKNCFGCIVGKRKPQWHFKAGVTRGRFADLLLDIHNTVAPVLTIADAVVAMEGNGPGSGDPRKVGLLFASSNALSMDKVISLVLGVKEGDVPLFQSAKARGLSDIDLNNIEIIGPEIDELIVRGFKPPKIIDMMFGPPFLRQYFKKSLTARPKVDHNICDLCGDCIGTCPVEVMSVKNKRLDIFYRDCIHCFCCQEVCPKGAITPGQGWLLKLLKWHK